MTWTQLRRFIIFAIVVCESRKVVSSSDDTKDRTVNVAEINNPDPADFTLNSEEESEETNEDGLMVTTTHGDIIGHHLHEELPIRSFIDIPYGKIDNLFQAPTDPDSWTQIHNISDHSIVCPQIQDENIFMGEKDCLVLSVFTPSEAHGVDVLFHIHESNFLEGSGDFNKYGPQYLVPEGVILVLPNYRLGPLGFLCLQDEVAPGNAALKDLTLALEWVKDNIEAFGGDPDKITVSADGTAGVLAGLLALSPTSRHLFNKVITESGSLLAPWAIDRDPTHNALKLVELLIEDLDSAEIDIEKISIETILQTALKENLFFKPCLDKHEVPFLENTPWHILTSDSFNTNATFMIGAANKAGILNAEMLTNESLEELNSQYDRLIPADLSFRNNATGRTLVANLIKQQYFEGYDISEETIHDLALLYTDSEFLGPSLRAARYLAEAGSTVYLYEFAFDGEFNRVKLEVNSSMSGAMKGDIIGYVFVQNNEVPTPDTNESNVVKYMTEAWISFIKTGEPRTDNSTWEPIHADNESLVIIGAVVDMEYDIYPHRMKLWTQLYDLHFIELSNRASQLPPPHHVIAMLIALITFQSFYIIA